MMSMVFSSRCASSRSGSFTFSATFMELNSAPNWKATPILRRSSSFSSAFRLPISLPSSLTLFFTGGIRPTRWRSSVVLPDPLPPMITMISPSWTCMVTSNRTWRGPNDQSR